MPPLNATWHYSGEEIGRYRGPRGRQLRLPEVGYPNVRNGGEQLTSVLFPSGGTAPDVDTPPDCFHDLRLGDIVAAVCEGHPDDRVARLFYQPLREVSAVEHRHQVFGDLERSNVRQSITDFTDAMATMRGQLRQADWVQHRWQRHGWFVHAVSTFCNAVTALRDGLARSELLSRGLRDIADYLSGYLDSDTFRTLADDTRAILTELGDIRYTVHINDRHVRVEKYSGQADYSHDAFSMFERFASEINRDYGVPIKDDAEMTPVEQRVLECVANLYPDAFARLEEFFRRHRHFIEPTISRFDREIRFYLMYLAFVERFTAAGVSFSYPEVTDTPGALSADHACDLALAIKTEGEQTALVGNAFHLSGPERVLVVTGPNQGGKTTFARTIGQCAYLASLGCPIPAKRAVFTLPDAIYTHFDRQETLSNLHGKLHDELVRIRDILSQATAASLIIMNESFSSTTVSDALQIGTDIIRRIIKRDSTAIYVSFLGELARVDPACVSMVGEVAADDPTRRTFTFTRRPADGLAYAAALAAKYGLTYDILRQRITS
jgi:DNA mismatch repair protein MutS